MSRSSETSKLVTRTQYMNGDQGLYRAGQAGRKSVAGVAKGYVLPDCRQDLGVSPEHLVAPQIAFVVQYRADVPTAEHPFEGVPTPSPAPNRRLMPSSGLSTP